MIGKGQNYWSPVHVDDLAQGYVAALEIGRAEETYALVDDEPLRLRALTDALCDAAGQGRVGTIPPPLIGALIGSPLVKSLTTSWRVRNAQAREQLGWRPARPRFSEGIGEVVAQLRATP